MIVKTSSSYTVSIYIAGNYDDAIRVCKSFCEVGFCVSVVKCDYVYTQGMESGVCVKVINYPRFPKRAHEIWLMAENLGDKLLKDLYQGSYTMDDGVRTVFKSIRSVDNGTQVSLD